RAATSLSDPRNARSCDLVETIEAVYYQGALQSQHAEGLSQLFYQFERIDADHLARGVRRIGERSQQVEHGAHSQFAADALYLLHRRMQVRRVQKTDTNFAQALCGTLKGLLNVQAEGLDDVGGPTLRTDAPVAVLGDADSSASGHKG